MNIALTSVFVNSPVEAFKFYTEVLGFISRMYMPEYNLAIVVSAEAPDGTGLLLEPNDNPIASTYQKALKEAGLPVITFGTSDIQKDYVRLVELGVKFKSEPNKTDWGTVAVFDDTFGNFIQLFQM